MWLYIKANREADKWFEENKGPDDYYTAEFAIGYVLTHHPLFLVETFFEALFIVGLVVFFNS